MSGLKKPTPYQLHVDDELLSTTKQKLQLARYPQELDDIGDNDWSQGAKVKVVKRLATYWQNGFDWRAEETRINTDFAQFTVKVDVPNHRHQILHYAHHRSTSPKAIPLIFVAGWPGSFLEARKLIKPLTSPPSDSTQAFHLIVASIPGFGPGHAATKSVFGPEHTARAFKQLMVDVLGYDRFVTQGGDFGAIITRVMALQYPQHVRACHFNFLPCYPPSWYKAPVTFGRLILNPWLYTTQEQKNLKQMQHFDEEQTGYLKLQSTRPQSLGFGLGDSPIGLLAWFVEKYHDWMDTENYTMPDDEVLAFVMMHWMQGATPGFRYYKAAFIEGALGTTNLLQTYVATPVGVSCFPKEVAVPPKDWMQAVVNLQSHKEHETGGHFPSVECPDLSVEDIREFFTSDVVKNAMGS